MLDNEVNAVDEYKAFLLDWLFKFGYDHVTWNDIRKLVREHRYATWSFILDDGYITKIYNPFGDNEYKLAKKGVKFLEQRS